MFQKIGINILNKIKRIVRKILLHHEFVHILIIILICFIMIGLYTLFPKFVMEHISITTFISFLLAFFATRLSTFISSSVTTWLNSSFDEVKHTYSRNRADFTEGSNGFGEKIKFPITVEQKISAGSIIKIIDDKEKMYELPKKIIEEFDNIIKNHKGSSIYNQLNIRLDDFSFENNEFILYTSRTTFYKSLVTNRALEYKFTDNLTIKDLFCYGPFLPSIKNSQLSNHLGFNAFVKTSDDVFVFVKRSGDVSIGKNSLGCGISASLKSKYALNDMQEFDFAGLKHAVESEFKDELFIGNDRKNFTLDERCNIISFYRDWIEGGKPQFLIYMELNISAKEVENIFSEGLEKAKNKKIKAMKQENENRKRLNKNRPFNFNKIRHSVVSFLSIESERSVVEKMKIDGNKLIFIPKKDFMDFEIVNVDHVCMANKIYPVIPTMIGLMLEVRKYLGEIENNESLN